MLKLIKELTKEDKKVLAKVGILIILFIWPMLWTEFYTEQKYSYDSEAEVANIVSVVLQFDQYEGDPIFIELELTAHKFIDKADKLYRSHERTFLLDNLNLTTGWSDLHILFFVDEYGYENYREIVCSWQVENTTRVLKKSQSLFVFNGNDYVLSDSQIDNAMFKTPVPNRVEAYVKLYTG